MSRFYFFRAIANDVLRSTRATSSAPLLCAAAYFPNPPRVAPPARMLYSPIAPVVRSTFAAISSCVSQASKRELAQSTREATCSGVSRWAIRLRKSISSPSCCSTMTACCQGISVSNRPIRHPSRRSATASIRRCLRSLSLMLGWGWPERSVDVQCL
jgi:hypothetical protein